MIHFIAAWIFIVAFVVRIYWAIVGNHHARAIFLPPFLSGAWWRGLFSQMRYYLFLKRGVAICGSATTRSRRRRCSSCTRSARCS